MDDHRGLRPYEPDDGAGLTAGLHVVFGTGPAGRAVVEALLDRGAAVRMINRSGTPAVKGVETLGGDAANIAGAVLVTIGFVLLGSRFNYLDFLEEPANNILLRFHADAFVIGALFVGLVAASSLLIALAWLSRHLTAADRRRTRRLMVASGIAAGVVQVVGLMRWPLLIPQPILTYTFPRRGPAARCARSRPSRRRSSPNSNSTAKL